MKQIIGITLAFIIGTLGIAWIIQGNDFFMYKVFAPRQEAVRRKVFEQSRAFNQGMIQELENMQFEYVKEKDPEARAALRGVILHRASGYNLTDPDVPYSLRTFINELKNN